MGAAMVGITFQQKGHHTPNVSDTIFVIAKFLEMTEQILGENASIGK